MRATGPGRLSSVVDASAPSCTFFVHHRTDHNISHQLAYLATHSLNVNECVVPRTYAHRRFTDEPLQFETVVFLGMQMISGAVRRTVVRGASTDMEHYHSMYLSVLDTNIQYYIIMLQYIYKTSHSCNLVTLSYTLSVSCAHRQNLFLVHLLSQNRLAPIPMVVFMFSIRSSFLTLPRKSALASRVPSLRLVWRKQV